MLQDLPVWERPREKLLSFGAGSLSNSELIAILISSGSKEDSAISLASKIIALEQGSLSKLSSYEPEEFMKLPGIGMAKACSLVAAMELGRRISVSPKEEKLHVGDSKKIAALFMDDMRYLNKETVKIAMLDIQSRLIGKMIVSIGGISDAAANPREIFAPAIKKGAAAIIVVHNHPSGECKPSNADIECTKRLVESGKLLGISVLDHIIIGDNCYTSLHDSYNDIF